MDYPLGTIVKIRMKNFLPFDDQTVKPTPGVNVILGPNGTGKSSIICAIYLPLGGKPEDMGRDPSYRKCIKRGFKSARVDVAISNGEKKGHKQMRMEINHDKKYPTYYVDDVAVNAEDVEYQFREIRNSYNINIHSSFASSTQDDVSAPAHMSIHKLLNTSTTNDRNYEYLKNQIASLRSCEKQIKLSQVELEKIEHQRKNLKPIIEYQNTLNCQKKLKLLETKEAVLEHQTLEANIVYAKKRLTFLENEREEFHVQVTEYKDKIIIFTKPNNEANQKLSRLESELEETKEKLNNQESEIETLIEEKRENVKVAENKRSSEELAAYEKMTIFQQKVNEAHESMEKNYVDVDLMRLRVGKKIDRKLILFERKSDIMNELQEMNYKEKCVLDEAVTVEKENIDDRLCFMKHHYPDDFKAYKYYQENRDKFKGKIYHTAMDIKFKSLEAVKYFETVIDEYDQTVFVCQFEEDKLKLTTPDAPWQVIVFLISDIGIPEDSTLRVTECYLKNNGFETSFTELFEAPAALRQYYQILLNNEQVPIGKTVKIDESRIDNLRVRKIHVFLANDLIYKITKSKYVNEVLGYENVLLSESPLKDATIWLDNIFQVGKQIIVENKDFTTKKSNLSVSLEQVEQEILTIEKEVDSMIATIADWKYKKKVSTSWEDKLSKAKTLWDNLKKERQDMPDLNEAIEREKYNLMKNLPRKKQRLEYEMATISFKIRRLNHSIEECCKEIDALEICRKSNAKYFAQWNCKIEETKKNLKTYEEKKIAAKEKMFSLCNLRQTIRATMTDSEILVWNEMQKEFLTSKVPHDVNDLHREIGSVKRRLESIGDCDDDCTAESTLLRTLDQKFSVCNEKHSELVTKRDELNDELARNMKQWQTELDASIRKINARFSSFLKEFGYRGQIRIDIPDDPLDIENYRIQTLVAFRRGQSLKELNSIFHSEGERRVATVLYFLALQELSPTASRCIDEITQGMDVINEAKVFNIMMKFCPTFANTQYFIESKVAERNRVRRKCQCPNNSLMENITKKMDTRETDWSVVQHAKYHILVTFGYNVYNPYTNVL